MIPPDARRTPPTVAGLKAGGEGSRSRNAGGLKELREAPAESLQP